MTSIASSSKGPDWAASVLEMQLTLRQLRYSFDELSRQLQDEHRALNTQLHKMSQGQDELHLLTCELQKDRQPLAPFLGFADGSLLGVSNDGGAIPREECSDEPELSMTSIAAEIRSSFSMLGGSGIFAGGDGNCEPIPEEPSSKQLHMGGESGLRRHCPELQEQLRQIVGWADDGATNSVVMVASQFEAEMMGGLVTFVHSNVFQGVISVAIITNVVIIGTQMHLDMPRALQGKDSLEWEHQSDVFFAVLFSTELFLRIVADRLRFFTGPDWMWHWFDLIVVCQAVFDLLLSSFSISFLRILRIFRMVRMAKVIRLFRFLRELRIMAVSLVSCLVSLTWAFVLLLLVMFLFGMILLDAGRNYARNGSPLGEEEHEFILENLTVFYGSVPLTIYSLFLAITGGMDWYDLAHPFSMISGWYAVIFTFFMVFVLFGLLNVLVGVFVQRANEMMAIDRDLAVQEEMSKNAQILNQMKRLFKDIDVDNSGTLTWEELGNNLQDERVAACFNLLQIDVTEAKGLFQLLDIDESGEVGIEEFVMGCMRLKGAAKSIDLATMLYENKRHCMKWNHFYEQFLRMNETIEVMRSMLVSRLSPPKLPPRVPSGNLTTIVDANLVKQP